MSSYTVGDFLNDIAKNGPKDANGKLLSVGDHVMSTYNKSAGSIYKITKITGTNIDMERQFDMYQEKVKANKHNLGAGWLVKIDREFITNKIDFWMKLRDLQGL